MSGKIRKNLYIEEDLINLAEERVKYISVDDLVNILLSMYVEGEYCPEDDLTGDGDWYATMGTHEKVRERLEKRDDNDK